MSAGALLAEAKRAGLSTLIYGAGSLLPRAIGFLLLPLYTRLLTPADYGTVAVATAVTAVVGLFLPLGLHGAVPRFYFAAEDDAAWASTMATLWLALAAVALAMTLALNALGATVAGNFLLVPYSPYLRIALWTAFANALSLIPLTTLRVREKAAAYVAITIGGALLTTFATLWFVVVRREGAYGYLLGNFVGAVALVPINLLFLLPRTRLRIRWAVLAAAFAYSLPLVPHAIAGWLLELSDRIILPRYVSMREVGIYSLGYQFGSLMYLAITALNSAWVPLAYKRLADGERGVAELARLATAYVAFVAFAGTGLLLLAPDAIRLVTAEPYHGAASITPWVVAAYVCVGLYYIPANILLARDKTKVVPVITVAAGILNVVGNVLLIPHLGILAAALVTFLCYAMMLLLMGAAAWRTQPLPYDTGRLARIAALSALCIALAHLFTSRRIPLDLALKLALLATLAVVLFRLVSGSLRGEAAEARTVLAGARGGSP